MRHALWSAFTFLAMCAGLFVVAYAAVYVLAWMGLL
jgi:hypothetical protein